MAHRIEKVEALIQEEISRILLYKNEWTRFRVPNSNAGKFYPLISAMHEYIYAVFGKEKRQPTLERIEEATGHIVRSWHRVFNLRYVPELRFYIDDTLDYAQKINELLEENSRRRW